MERAWRQRSGSAPTNDHGTGVGFGKRSLTDSLAPAAAPARPYAPGRWLGIGAGAASSSAASTPKQQAQQQRERPTMNNGALPRLNLYPSDTADEQSRALDGGDAFDGEVSGAETADVSSADASGSEGKGRARGWGVSDIVRGVADTANAVTGAVLGAAGIPVISHRTADKAPGAPNTRTTVGVGEMITFKSNMPGTWKADKGAKGFPKRATGDQFVWAAMSTKGTAKITFDPGIEGQPKLEVEIEVLAPTVDYLNARAVVFPGQAAGVAGVQMETDVTFGPDTVSFANTMWWEKPGPATNATGYFQDHVSKRGHQLPYHHPNPDDLQLDANNSGIVDAAGWWDFAGPYSAGSFEWVIPTYYRVVDDKRHLIENVVQKCEIAADGTMTVTKKSSSMSRKP